MSSAQVESVAGFVLLAIVVMVLCYLLPAAIRSRQVVADARIDDRFSTGLRVLARAGDPPPHYDSTARVYLHTPRSQTPSSAEPEAPMDRQPVPPTSRVAAQARREASMRAARAAASSRRAAAARRRRVLLLTLLAVTAATWTLFATFAFPVAAPIIASVVLVAAAVAGRRAAVRAASAEAREQTTERSARSPKPGLHAGPPEVPAEEGPTTTSGSVPVRHARRASQGDARRTAEEPVAGSARSTAHAEQDDAGEREVTAPTRTPISERTGSLRISVDPTTIDAPANAPVQDGWTPVPVPVPTYTLKASAPRREVPAYEAPAWEPAEAPADAGEERELTLAEVEQAVRERQAAQAPAATDEQVLAEQEAARARVAAAAGDQAQEPKRPAVDLQSVLERRRAVGQ